MTAAPVKEREILVNWVPSLRIGNWVHCFYCGLEPTTVDHIIPRAFLFVEGDNQGNDRGLTVPACRYCNSSLSDLYFTSMAMRCKYRQKRLQKTHWEFVRMAPWTANEMKALDVSLRNHVAGRQGRRYRALTQVYWQTKRGFFEMFDTAYREAKLQFPENIKLHRYMEPPWATDNAPSEQPSQPTV